MYIARKLCCAMGGRLTCESRPDGVYYALTVPLTPAAAVDDSRPLTSLRILYAEVLITQHSLSYTILQHSAHR